MGGHSVELCEDDDFGLTLSQKPITTESQLIIRSMWAKTYHQAATNNGVRSSKCDHAIFYTDVSFALFVGHHVAKISNVSVVRYQQTNT